MQDNEKLNFSYLKRAAGNPAERTLITLERSQKLDLLIHLLTNLRQAVIVCGPEGIGKTTLLQILQTNRQDQWQIFLLQGSSALSFENIVINLSQYLNIHDSNYGFDLASLRDFCEKQKVVLIIDDAGDLVPGLIGELVDFSESLSGLRLVFSMTYDEFHIKSSSDKAVDDCHFIEIPPLSPKECTEFLQNLSAQPGAIISFNAVTDSLVENLYKETHGIPGKILAEIPKFNQYKSRKSGRLGLSGTTLAFISLAAGAWFLINRAPDFTVSDSSKSKALQTTENVSLPPVMPLDIPNIEPVLPAVEIPEQNIAHEKLIPGGQAEKHKIETVASTNTEAKTIQNLDQQPEQTKPSLAGQIESAAPPAEQSEALPKPASDTGKPEAANASQENKAFAEPKDSIQTSNTPTDINSNKPSKIGNNLDWINAQPAGNYTLQVMILSSRQAVTRLLKKYDELSDKLSYYPIIKNEQEKYVVIYGSFESIAEARKYKTILPNEFKQSLEKKFKTIQSQSNR